MSFRFVASPHSTIAAKIVFAKLVVIVTGTHTIRSSEPPAIMLRTAAASSLAVLATSIAAASASPDPACAAVVAQHGCDVFCGFESVTAGATRVCLPSSTPGRLPFPFGISGADADELCDLSSRNYGCSDTCGFKWSPEAAECRHVSEAARISGNKPAGALRKGTCVSEGGRVLHLTRLTLWVPPWLAGAQV